METNSVLEEINKFKQAVYDKLKEILVSYGTGWFDGDKSFMRVAGYAVDLGYLKASEEGEGWIIYRLTSDGILFLEEWASVYEFKRGRERQRLEQEKEEQNSQAFREISKQLEEDAGKVLEALEEHAEQVRITLERIQLLQSVAEYNKATKGGDDGKLK